MPLNRGSSARFNIKSILTLVAIVENTFSVMRVGGSGKPLQFEFEYDIVFIFY